MWTFPKDLGKPAMPVPPDRTGGEKNACKYNIFLEKVGKEERKNVGKEGGTIKSVKCKM